MNRDSQRRQIRRFLEGKGKKDIDAFCLYQWVDRCHYEGWWDLAVKLAPSIPPNCLGQHYHKRLDFILSECRRNLDQRKGEFVEIGNPGASYRFLIPSDFWATCKSLLIELGGKSSKVLRFHFLGVKFLFLEQITLNGCTFCFLDKSAEDFKSWLNSHGFGHIADGVIWDRKAAQKDRVRLRVKWEDATNLLISYMDDYKSTDKVLGRALIKAVFTVENGNWLKYVSFLREKYGISASDGRLIAVRQKLVSLLSKFEGYEDIIKTISME